VAFDVETFDFAIILLKNDFNLVFFSSSVFIAFEPGIAVTVRANLSNTLLQPKCQLTLNLPWTIGFHEPRLRDWNQ
jgi:hypothetical protein